MKENVNCVKLNSEIRIYYGNKERQFHTTDQQVGTACVCVGGVRGSMIPKASTKKDVRFSVMCWHGVIEGEILIGTTRFVRSM